MGGRKLRGRFTLPPFLAPIFLHCSDNLQWKLYSFCKLNKNPQYIIASWPQFLFYKKSILIMETRGWWTSLMNVYPWSPSRGCIIPKIFPWKQLQKAQCCTIHLCLLPAKGTEACWWLAGSLCPRCSRWELSPWSLWKDEMAGDMPGLWASLPCSVCLRSVRFPRSCVQRMRL